MSDREDLLNEAKRLTTGDRMDTYGPPVENHEHIATIASAITGRHISAQDVAIVLIATKLARRQHSPLHADSYVDLMAYAGILFEIEANAAMEDVSDDETTTGDNSDSTDPLNRHRIRDVG